MPANIATSNAILQDFYAHAIPSIFKNIFPEFSWRPKVQDITKDEEGNLQAVLWAIGEIHIYGKVDLSNEDLALNLGSSHEAAVRYFDRQVNKTLQEMQEWFLDRVKEIAHEATIRNLTPDDFKALYEVEDE